MLVFDEVENSVNSRIFTPLDENFVILVDMENEKVSIVLSLVIGSR